MARRMSVVERELEALLTLPRPDIDRACSDADACARFVEFCIDEEIELRDAADEAHDRGDEDLARHCEQEASAWRHTARVLRDSLSATAASAQGAPQRSARLA